MSSSPYQRVTVEIENGNLAMVLATDTPGAERHSQNRHSFCHVIHTHVTSLGFYPFSV